MSLQCHYNVTTMFIITTMSLQCHYNVTTMFIIMYIYIFVLVSASQLLPLRRYNWRSAWSGSAANNDQTWTPVCGKRRKRIPLSEAQLRRIPPHCRRPPPSDDDSSSESDIPLTIPENATVNYKVVDGTPGFSITTRKTRHWTPIASRTRA